MNNENELTVAKSEADSASVDSGNDRHLQTNPVSRLLAGRQGLAGMRLEHWKGLLPVIYQHEQSYLSLTPRELKKASLALRFRARSGESLSKLLPEAYALCRVVSAQVLGMRHYDVQILGGIALFKGRNCRNGNRRGEDADSHTSCVFASVDGTWRSCRNRERLPGWPRC